MTDLLRNPRMDGDTLHVSVHGDIDLSNAPDLRGSVLRALADFEPKSLSLDLQGVHHIDSSGIAVMVEAAQRLRPGKGRVSLLNLQPRVRTIVNMARLDTIFNTTDAAKPP